MLAHRRLVTRSIVGAALVSAALVAAPTTSPATAAAAPSAPATFSFTGSGYGHGVGMSQYGARGMALEGSTAAQIVTHYYTGTTVAPVADTMNIRVNILRGRSVAVFRSERLAANGGAIEVGVSGVTPVVGGPADLWTVRGGAGRITLSRTRAGVTKVIGTGTTLVVRWAGTRNPGRAAGGGATVLNIAASAAGLRTAGHRYRYGWVDAATTTRTAGTLEVVNSVRVHDEYLLGIGEVPSSWPAAALQAQVLAARSYALSRYGTGRLRGTCRCQVDSGHGPYWDQTFLGWLKESSTMGARWRAAVLATAATATTGRTIVSAGKPITAFYFSASGGTTQASQDVWGGTLPYAQRVDDHWSLDPSVPWSRWALRTRTQAQVAAVFGLPDVTRIDLSNRQPSGALLTATGYSSTGASATVSGARFASSLSFPSRWVWRAVDTETASAVDVAVTTARRSTSTVMVVAPSDQPQMVALASVLSVRKGWPLLLVSSSSVPAATAAELVRRKATGVYVVGTPDEVSADVVTALKQIVPAVSRFGGATDADLSATVARALPTADGTPALVASATDPESAVSAAAMAAAYKRPFLLLPGGTASNAAVTDYLASLAPSRTYVVGTSAAVSDDVIGALPAVARLAGATSADTTTQVLSLLGTTVPGRVSIATSATATTALLAAPTAPVVVVATDLPVAATRLLQRGVPCLTAGADVPVALITAARRA